MDTTDMQKNCKTPPPPSFPAPAQNDWLWLYLSFPTGQGVRDESLRARWINSAYLVLRFCPLISLSVYPINKSSPASPQLPRSLHLYVQLPRRWNQAPLALPWCQLIAVFIRSLSMTSAASCRDSELGVNAFHGPTRLFLRSMIYRRSPLPLCGSVIREHEGGEGNVMRNIIVSSCSSLRRQCTIHLPDTHLVNVFISGPEISALFSRWDCRPLANSLDKDKESTALEFLCKWCLGSASWLPLLLSHEAVDQERGQMKKDFTRFSVTAEIFNPAKRLSSYCVCG